MIETMTCKVCERSFPSDEVVREESLKAIGTTEFETTEFTPKDGHEWYIQPFMLRLADGEEKKSMLEPRRIDCYCQNCWPKLDDPKSQLCVIVRKSADVKTSQPTQ